MPGNVTRRVETAFLHRNRQVEAGRIGAVGKLSGKCHGRGLTPRPHGCAMIQMASVFCERERSVIPIGKGRPPPGSIDTKKKEPIGPHKNAGSDYRPKGCPDLDHRRAHRVVASSKGAVAQVGGSWCSRRPDVRARRSDKASGRDRHAQAAGKPVISGRPDRNPLERRADC